MHWTRNLTSVGEGETVLFEGDKGSHKVKDKEEIGQKTNTSGGNKQHCFS
jgi:hypothetical protein